MNYLFDTNIIIAFLNNNQKVVELIKNLSVVKVSAITVGEMFFGAKNSINYSKNLKLYQEFFQNCEILEISQRTADYYSTLKIELKKLGKPIPENDFWIAANAKENNLTIITKDKHLLINEFIDSIEI
jgi:tRNA(fMet)-specific endonuclease VapC